MVPFSTILSFMVVKSSLAKMLANDSRVECERSMVLIGIWWRETERSLLDFGLI
jgi:hypothetical protein